MGLCSHALFACLQSDLSRVLPSLPYSRILNGGSREVSWPGITPREFASLSLADSLLKKFQDEVSPEADDKALTKFLEFNRKCEVNSPIDLNHITEIEYIAVGEAREIFYDFWFRPGGDYILSVEEIQQGMMVGPGASIGVSGTSFYQKLAASTLTGTRKSLYSLYKSEVSKYPLWLETEKIRSSHFEEFTLVEGSRLSFVPKTSGISRTICTEPLLNMLVQKGIASCIERQLNSKFGINLSRQPGRNRVLARIGSRNDTYGTIDLSNASDSISIGLMRELLPPYVTSWLMEARSPVVTLPGGKVVPLHMVSSMGNAFTFPLQTALFASIVQGVYRTLDIVNYKPYHWRSNWGVFGDDIIVERKAYNLVIKILERFGFVVNRDKSYGEGPFRESCGADFWLGIDVRGVYCRSLKTKQDLYSLINRLNVWSSNHEVPLTNTVSYLIKAGRVPIIPVPPWEDDSSGLKVPLGMIPFTSLKKSKDTGSIVYRRYMPRSKEISLLAVEQRPVKRPNWFNNHAGILLSAISGHLRSGSITERMDRPHYKMRVGIAPCWDYVNPLYTKLTCTGWQRWLNTFVELNLGSVQLGIVNGRYTIN